MRTLILLIVTLASVLSFPTPLSCDRYEPSWNCRQSS